jgi:hypothetical protein
MQLTPVVFYDGVHWNSANTNLVYAQFTCREHGGGIGRPACDSKDQILWGCLLSFLPVPFILIVFDRIGTLPVKV